MEKGFTFENLVKLSLSDKQSDWQERARLFEDIFAGKPYPSKITAGRLELDFGEKCPIIDSEVDLLTATAKFSAGDKLRGELFTSATHYLGVARIWGDYTLSINLPKYLSAPEGKDAFDIDGGFGYPKATVISDGEFTYYEQTTFTDFIIHSAPVRLWRTCRHRACGHRDPAGSAPSGSSCYSRNYSDSL